MELLLFHWSEAIFVFSLGKCVRYTNLPCVFLSTNTRSNSHLYSLQTDIESCPLWVKFSKQISCIFLTILKCSMISWFTKHFRHDWKRLPYSNRQMFLYLSQVYIVEENFPLEYYSIFLRTITSYLTHRERKTQQTGQ